MAKIVLANVNVAIIYMGWNCLVAGTKGLQNVPKVLARMTGQEYFDRTAFDPITGAPVFGSNVYRLMTVAQISKSKGLSKAKASALLQEDPAQCVAGLLTWKDLDYVGAQDSHREELIQKDKDEAKQAA